MTSQLKRMVVRSASNTPILTSSSIRHTLFAGRQSTTRLIISGLVTNKLGQHNNLTGVVSRLASALTITSLSCQFNYVWSVRPTLSEMWVFGLSMVISSQQAITNGKRLTSTKKRIGILVLRSNLQASGSSSWHQCKPWASSHITTAMTQILRGMSFPRLTHQSRSSSIERRGNSRVKLLQLLRHQTPMRQVKSRVRRAVVQLVAEFSPKSGTLTQSAIRSTKPKNKG